MIVLYRNIFFLALFLFSLYVNNLLSSNNKSYINNKINFFEISGHFSMNCNFSSITKYRDLILKELHDNIKYPSPFSFLKRRKMIDNKVVMYKSFDCLRKFFSKSILFILNIDLHISEYAKISSQIHLFNYGRFNLIPIVLKCSDINSLFFLNLFSGITYYRKIFTSNNFNNYLSIKNLFSEFDTSLGVFRFGYIPISFGLGLLYNGKLDKNQCFNTIGCLFATNLLGYYLISGYEIINTKIDYINFSKLTLNNNISSYLLHSHRLFLSIGKPVEPKKEWILNYKKFSKIFNYSLLTSFQIKKNHLMMEHFFCNDNCYSMRINDKFIVKKIYINTFMIWNKISSRYFNLNYEIVGVLRRIISSKCLKTKRNVPNIVWCFHGGAALKVNYHIIRNKLMFSVNAGVALSDINNIFYFLKKHLFDKTIVQNRVISKFAFSKNYTVDFLLFREILKGISDAKYLASNITYNISNKLDFIFSTIVSSSNLLKNKFEEKKTITIEVDLSSTFKMLNGFYVTTKFAWLIPFLKLNYLVFFEDINKEKFLKKSDIFQIFKVSCSIGTRF